MLYYDLKKWDGSLDLYDMFGADQWGLDRELLQLWVPNYQINLIDAGNIADEKLFQTDLREIFGLLKYRGRKKELREYMQEKEAYFRNMDWETYWAAGTFLHSERLLNDMKKQKKEEKADMCQALEDLYQEGIEEGIERGIERGTEQGIRVLIETMQELDQTKEYIIRKIQEKFSVNFAEAGKYAEKYFK